MRNILNAVVLEVGGCCSARSNVVSLFSVLAASISGSQQNAVDDAVGPVLLRPLPLHKGQHERATTGSGQGQTPATTLIQCVFSHRLAPGALRQASFQTDRELIFGF